MDTSTLDLSALADDGDTLELEDGRTLRLRIVSDDTPAMVHINDADVWGRLEWVRGAHAQRPLTMDGRARVLEHDYPHRLWWQPYEEDRDPATIKSMEREVRRLLEEGFHGVIVELRQMCDLHSWHTIDQASLWGIDSLEGGYLADVLSDLVAEVLP